MSLSDADLYQRGAKTLIACWEVTGAGAFAKAARRWHDSAPATEKLAAQSRAAAAAAHVVFRFPQELPP